MTKHLQQSGRKRPSKGWSPERRARQAALIRRIKPWLRSTGPKTEAGKTRCAAYQQIRTYYQDHKSGNEQKNSGSHGIYLGENYEIFFTMKYVS